ncbi:MAG: hypothetical protein Rhob2KO_00240 [Rhodopirellula baltica]
MKARRRDAIPKSTSVWTTNKDPWFAADCRLNREGSRERHRAAEVTADDRYAAANHYKGTRPTKNALHASGFA